MREIQRALEERVHVRSLWSVEGTKDPVSPLLEEATNIGIGRLKSKTGESTFGDLVRGPGELAMVLTAADEESNSIEGKILDEGLPARAAEDYSATTDDLKCFPRGPRCPGTGASGLQKEADIPKVTVECVEREWNGEPGSLFHGQ